MPLRTSEVCCVSEVVLRIVGWGLAPRFHAPRAFHDGKAVISRPQVISRIRRIHFIAAECRFQGAVTCNFHALRAFHDGKAVISRPQVISRIRRIHFIAAECRFQGAVPYKMRYASVKKVGYGICPCGGILFFILDSRKGIELIRF